MLQIQTCRATVLDFSQKLLTRVSCACKLSGHFCIMERDSALRASNYDHLSLFQCFLGQGISSKYKMIVAMPAGIEPAIFACLSHNKQVICTGEQRDSTSPRHQVFPSLQLPNGRESRHRGHTLQEKIVIGRIFSSLGQCEGARGASERPCLPTDFDFYNVVQM
jgi:hypothetical protein